MHFTLSSATVLSQSIADMVPRFVRTYLPLEDVTPAKGSAKATELHQQR